MPAVALILMWLCAITLIPLSVAYNIPIGLSLRRASNLPHFDNTPVLASPVSWLDKSPQPSSTVSQRKSAISSRRDAKYMFDERQFNATTASTCNDALSGVKSVSNPSGLAACFNIAFLNEDTSIFGADIRLYYISNANGEFNNTRWEDFDLKPDSRLIDISGLKRVFQNSTSSVKEDSPHLVMQWQYSGRVNELIPIKKLTLDEHRYLLLPNISITTNSPSQPDTLIQTNIAPDTLSYTAGYLANGTHLPYNITTGEAKTQLKYIILASLEYEIPGMSLGIFPMGLIVTGVWAGLFIAIVGYGTYERKQYRDFHERRLKYAASTRGYGNRPIVP
ncbi:hypothetical protein MferCBS31731_005586 [Microsporum ferrugineum]